MKSILRSLIFLCCIFLVSKYIFDPTHLYYELWWLDIPMHFLGGFGVASFSYSLLIYKKVPVSVIKITVMYITVALVWELYEYVTDIIFKTEINTLFDSTKDVLVGLLGSFFGYYYKIKK